MAVIAFVRVVSFPTVESHSAHIEHGSDGFENRTSSCHSHPKERNIAEESSVKITSECSNMSLRRKADTSSVNVGVKLRPKGGLNDDYGRGRFADWRWYVDTSLINVGVNLRA